MDDEKENKLVRDGAGVRCWRAMWPTALSSQLCDLFNFTPTTIKSQNENKQKQRWKKQIDYKILLKKKIIKHFFSPYGMAIEPSRYYRCAPSPRVDHLTQNWPGTMDGVCRNCHRDRYTASFET